MVSVNYHTADVGWVTSFAVNLVANSTTGSPRPAVVLASKSVVSVIYHTFAALALSHLLHLLAVYQLS
jgi:hypothetical protein